MFDNIGKTIKITAKVFFVLGAITIVGILVIWPFAFVLYGFGELVEKQVEIEKTLKKNSDEKNDDEVLPKI